MAGGIATGRNYIDHYNAYKLLCWSISHSLATDTILCIATYTILTARKFLNKFGDKDVIELSDR